MTKIRIMRPAFVEAIPSTIQDGLLYVSTNTRLPFTDAAADAARRSSRRSALLTGGSRSMARPYPFIPRSATGALPASRTTGFVAAESLGLSSGRRRKSVTAGAAIKSPSKYSMESASLRPRRYHRVKDQGSGRDCGGSLWVDSGG